jgi:hypothetical protein
VHRFGFGQTGQGRGLGTHETGEARGHRLVESHVLVEIDAAAGMRMVAIAAMRGAQFEDQRLFELQPTVAARGDGQRAAVGGRHRGAPARGVGGVHLASPSAVIRAMAASSAPASAAISSCVVHSVAVTSKVR